MVRRIYVEKKTDFAVEARGLLADLRQNLKMEELTGLRILNRYDIENVDDATYETSLRGIFAEAGVDLLFEETISGNLNSEYFVVEYLPGQYDQRADSAEQCIKLLRLIPFALPHNLRGTLHQSVLRPIRFDCHRNYTLPLLPA